jgi:hypothetical protein
MRRHHAMWPHFDEGKSPLKNVSMNVPPRGKNKFFLGK